MKFLTSIYTLLFLFFISSFHSEISAQDNLKVAKVATVYTANASEGMLEITIVRLEPKEKKQYLIKFAGNADYNWNGKIGLFTKNAAGGRFAYNGHIDGQKSTITGEEVWGGRYKYTAVVKGLGTLVILYSEELSQTVNTEDILAEYLKQVDSLPESSESNHNNLLTTLQSLKLQIEKLDKLKEREKMLSLVSELEKLTKSLLVEKETTEPEYKKPLGDTLQDWLKKLNPYQKTTFPRYRGWIRGLEKGTLEDFSKVIKQEIEYQHEAQNILEEFSKVSDAWEKYVQFSNANDRFAFNDVNTLSKTIQKKVNHFFDGYKSEVTWLDKDIKSKIETLLQTLVNSNQEAKESLDTFPKIYSSHDFSNEHDRIKMLNLLLQIHPVEDLKSEEYNEQFTKIEKLNIENFKLLAERVPIPEDTYTGTDREIFKKKAIEILGSVHTFSQEQVITVRMSEWVFRDNWTPLREMDVVIIIAPAPDQPYWQDQNTWGDVQLVGDYLSRYRIKLFQEHIANEWTNLKGEVQASCPIVATQVK